MRKLIKMAAAAGLILGAVTVFNRAVFKLAAMLERRPQIGFKTYNWRYGKLNYIKTGCGDPILLIHGADAGASLMEWENNIGALAREHTVYAVDLLGFGHSDKPGVEYSAYLYTTLINDFIYDVIGAQVNIAASGEGAAFAVMACVFKPQFYKKMLLVSPEGLRGIADAPTNRHVWFKWCLCLPVIGTLFYNILSSKACIRYSLRRSGFCDKTLATPEMAEERFVSAHIGGEKARLPLAACKSRFLHVSIEKPLSDIRIPLCVAWGEDSVDSFDDEYRAVERANPGARQVVFDDAKRLLHIEQSERFNELCLEFFK